MDRREAIQRVSILLGGTVLGANVFLTGCRSADEPGGGATFTEKDVAFLDEVAETILPATNTPGAKAAQVGSFMTVMVTDCYTARDQKIFREGMSTLDKASKKKFDKAFMNVTPQQRHELLVEIDKEAKEYGEKQKQERETNKQKEEEEREERKQNPTQESQKTPEEKQQEKPREEPARHYFRMMKELTLLGFFTSEVGQKQALRYNRVPGKYDGCVPYKKGDKAWA